MTPDIEELNKPQERSYPVLKIFTPLHKITR